MRPGGYALNPYAAAYIPIAKRDSEPEQHSKAFSEGKFEGSSKPKSQEGFSPKFQDCFVPSKNVNEVVEEQTIDEQFNIDMEYLKMLFPGLSEDSLTDAFLLNKCDLESTVDMLNHFEFSESLPETLDIGDVSESSSSAHCASVTKKQVSFSADGSSESPSSSQAVD